MAQVDFKAFDKKLKRIEDVKANVMPDAHAFFTAITPIKSGNARRNTRLNNNNDIEASYQYASNLDQGSSKQAPKGMTEPTVAKLRKLVDDYIKKIGA
jgi:hypothetical protein